MSNSLMKRESAKFFGGCALTAVSFLEGELTSLDILEVFLRVIIHWVLVGHLFTPIYSPQISSSVEVRKLKLSGGAQEIVFGRAY